MVFFIAFKNLQLTIYLSRAYLRPPPVLREAPPPENDPELLLRDAPPENDPELLEPLEMLRLLDDDELEMLRLAPPE